MAQEQKKSSKVKIIATKGEFDQALQDAGGKLVVVDFFATWCGPCKMIGPKLEGWAGEEEFKDIVFLKVDVDDNAEVAEEQEITAMPTFLLFKNGARVDEVVGANEAKIREAITKNK